MKPKIILLHAVTVISVWMNLLLPGRALAGDTSRTTERFSSYELPEPPRQHQPWNPPRKDFPTNLISSVETLFDLGLADPRGSEYREFEAVVGSGWDGGRKVTAHGWILPARSRQKQSFAVSWAGTIYPAINVGVKASVKEDVEALLRADEIWRKKGAGQSFAIRGPWGVRPEVFSMSETNMTAVKVALLLRLGEGKLARKYWNSWLAPGITILNENKESASNPFRTLAYEWVWALFDRALSAHMRGDDTLSLADCLKLNHVWPELEIEASKRGYLRSQNLESDGQQQERPYFEFLQPVLELLADQERRAKEWPRQKSSQIGQERIPDKQKRIAKLISTLEEMRESQSVWPGGLWLGRNPTILALVATGDDAVEPLLNCMEEDNRLTRSVSFRRNFTPNRVLPVREAARAALDGIIKVHFKTSTEYRAYWQKYKSVPLAERWYRTLLDNQAGRKQWMQAAVNILSRTDGREVYPWRNAPIPNATNHYAYFAQSLRSMTGPSVAELFIKRAAGDCSH